MAWLQGVSKAIDIRHGLLLNFTYMAMAAVFDEDAREAAQGTLDQLLHVEDGIGDYFLDPNAKPDLETMRRAGLIRSVPKLDQEESDGSKEASVRKPRSPQQPASAD
jgi:hypothetical protein